MTRVQANGLGFEVWDEGKGTPVVLLHGFPDTSVMWRHQVKALNGAGFRTIAPDMRGRGRSDRPTAVVDYAMPSIVADVTGIMDALGIERAHVVGHDWGAAVAWFVGMLAPNRVDHLVAISVGAPGAAGLPVLEALQNDWYLMRTLLQGGGEGFDAYAVTLSEPGALTAALNWYRANVPVERLVGGTGLKLPPVSAPTMGVFGTADLYLTEDAMVSSRSKVTGPWRYERLEGACHFIPLEEPDRLNALLLDF